MNQYCFVLRGSEWKDIAKFFEENGADERVNVKEQKAIDYSNIKDTMKHRADRNSVPWNSCNPVIKADTPVAAGK
ncbi:hypothetical protein CS542_09955 [Pedobacter sp. IW39]|nr:hypothetical protein CS542_09955 [Pedobacter sp. IW39]